MKALTVVAGLVLAVLSDLAIAQEPVSYLQAQALYQQVVSGSRTIQSLSPQEQQAVMMVARVSQRVCSGPSEKCRAVCGAANDLEDAAEQLKTCAEGRDYSDDCSAQFYNVQSAHSDYEDAVSDADGDCD